MPSDQVISDGNNALVKWYGRGRTFEHDFKDARQAYLRGKLLGGKLTRWKRQGTLLDIGCNNGFLGLGIRDHSEWEVHGLEISDEMANFVSEKLKIPTHHGTLEAAQLPGESYDFVICHDIIEHVNQPEKFISELARILRPGGRLQIITPNGLQDLAFAKRAFLAGTPLTMLLNHIMYFSPRALEIGLKRAGLRIVKSYCYDVRYAAKDFGLFGMNPPRDIQPGPEMKNALELPVRDELSKWDASKIEELRAHPRTSGFYGFFRETLPHILTFKVPPSLGIGHEIYALAEKTAER
jgi:SAM-dependent methyltransferase